MLKRTFLACYNTLIFYFSLAPSESIENIPYMGRPILDISSIGEGAIPHFLMMLLLFMLWYVNTKSMKTSLIISLLTGFVLEVLQIATPWRFFSPQDLLWDSVGSLCGYAITFSDRYFKGTYQLNNPECAVRGNKVKLVVFDCDGVLVDGYVSMFVADRFGFGSKVRSVYMDVIMSRKSFDGAMMELLNAFLGLEEDVVRKLLMQVPMMGGAEEAVKALKGSGIIVGVISIGASQYFLDMLKERLGLDFCVGTGVIIENGRFVGIKPPIVNMENKGVILSDIASRYGIHLSQCVAVGDDASNIPLFKSVGCSIMFDSGCLERELSKIKMDVIKRFKLNLRLYMIKRYIKKYTRYIIKSRNLMDVRKLLI